MAVTAKIFLCVKCGKLVDFVHWLGTENGDLYNHCEKCSGISRDWASPKNLRQQRKQGENKTCAIYAT